MPIIVGAPRSGTTLLRFMLDSHPQVAIPPETGFLAHRYQFKSEGNNLRREFFETITNYPPEMPGWVDFQIPADNFWYSLTQIQPFTVTEGYRTFYRLYATRFNKPRWGDKTPTYCLHLQKIEAVLPEAHFIHIIRDGRDVALSLRQYWFSPGDDMKTLAAHWCNCVLNGRQQGANCRHYLEVRYEALIQEPRLILKEICAFLNLPYTTAMESYYERTLHRLSEHKSRFKADGSLVVSHEQRLQQQHLTTQPPDPSRIFGWKKAMPLAERLEFEAVAAELLANLGYEVTEPGS